MKTNKYRGKCKTIDKQGGFVYGDLIQAKLNGGCYISDQYTGEVVRVFPDTVGQFTGAKTMKGNEVYPGTIAFKEIETEFGDTRIYFVCVWIEELFQFKWLTNIDYMDYRAGGKHAIETDFIFDLTESKHYHFAGDVFNNPELLNK